MYKFVIAFCLVAVAAAQISNEYLPPVQEHHEVQHFAAPAPAPVHVAEPVNEYLPPVSNHVDVEPAHSFSQDEGYRYKTARRRVYRARAYRARRRY